MSTQIPMQNYTYVEKEKSKFIPNMTGAIVGTAIGSLTQPFTEKVLNPNIAKLNDLDNDTIDLLHKKAEEAVEKNGLKDLGVKIKYLEPLAENEKPNSFLEKIVHKFDIIKQIQNGKNAGFLNADLKGVDLTTGNPVLMEKGNTILMPKKEMSLLAFHEMGHAINFNKSAIGKALQKIRPACIYLSAIPVLYGVFTKQEVAKDNEELSMKQKTKNFFRDNAGKLTFIATLPIIIEEAMASYKGEKIAEKMLPKELLGKLSKTNKFAFMSYIGMATFAGLGAYAGVKIKDKLAK